MFFLKNIDKQTHNKNYAFSCYKNTIHNMSFCNWTRLCETFSCVPCKKKQLPLTVNNVSNIAHKTFTIIVAGVPNANGENKHGIGYDGKLPWDIPEDLRFFKKTTTRTMNPEKQNAVIMGRKTFKSMHYHLLPKRFNICVSRTLTLDNDNNNNNEKNNYDDHDDFRFATSFEEALQIAKQRNDIENIFVIGGEQIYNEAINHPDCGEIIVNEINGLSVVCDTFFPVIDETKFFAYKHYHLTSNITTKYYKNRCLHPEKLCV